MAVSWEMFTHWPQILWKFVTLPPKNGNLVGDIHTLTMNTLKVCDFTSQAWQSRGRCSHIDHKYPESLWLYLPRMEILWEMYTHWLQIPWKFVTLPPENGNLVGNVHTLAAFTLKVGDFTSREWKSCGRCTHIGCEYPESLWLYLPSMELNCGRLYTHWLQIPWKFVTLPPKNGNLVGNVHRLTTNTLKVCDFTSQEWKSCGRCTHIDHEYPESLWLYLPRI